MIPQIATNIINKVKEKYTYDEAYSAFQAWRGKVGIDTNRKDNDVLYYQIVYFDFDIEWSKENYKSEFEKGWNADTYICNLTNRIRDCKIQPQRDAVQKYFDTLIKQKWTEEGDNLVNDKFYNYDTTYDGNGNCIYIINPQNLQYKLEEYQYKLSTTKNSKEKKSLQAAIDITEKNIQMIKSVSKEYSDYWTAWDKWTETYWKDNTDYANLWGEILKELKNGKPEPEPPTNNENETIISENNVLTPDLNTITSIGDDSATTKNVFESATDNTYSSIQTPNSSPTKNSSTQEAVHTRIYEYIPSSIQLDEMSLPLADNIDSDNSIDPSSGQHTDMSDLNGNSNPYQTLGNKSPSRALSIGFSYPLIRINDHYFAGDNIKYFSLETTSFIPTIELIIECQYNDLMKGNTIKDGDICSVFINQGHGSLKSYRGDFQITYAKIPEMLQSQTYTKIKIKIYGELYIPSLYDATQTFSFAGSSRDALIDIAQKLGLGFFFSDPENTQDSQMWYSMSDGDQKNIGASTSPAIEYIKNTALHAWKNFPSFYDCWIDPRYAISFINIAQMLGGSGLDEEIDLAFYNSVITAGRVTDGENRELTDGEKAAKPSPQMKLLTNFGEDEYGLTGFLVTKFSERNDNSITNKLGFSNTTYYNIKNTGITQVEDNSIEMKLSIPVNADKLKSGFYILGGPGQNLTYTQADNGSFVNQHTSVQGGQIAETFSDGEGKEIEDNGNNMLASGNTNKFYETAEGHNTLCNAWLKKKTIKMTLNGCNMQIMRGEKIPALLRDNFNLPINYMQANTNDALTYQRMLIQCTGWFIIQGIKWIFNRDKIDHATQWKTEITLTRREWPIPGYVKNSGQTKAEEDTISEMIITNNPETGSIKESVLNEPTNNNESDNTENAMNENLTTNGLNSYMVTIYNDIVNACSLGGVNIRLISGRRWPADENGNKVDNPIVQDGNLWKFINANGDIVWYSSKTSPHITGDAIDIINDQGTAFNDVAQYIISDNKTLYDMITNGVYLGLETSKDDTGNTVKHYHIGKPDKSNSATYTAQKNWWEVVVGNFKQSISYNNQKIQVAQYLKYANK